jgi:uncharacterized protein YutE (UPF0331/DUF86 family)/predicted nucleotidyltransferase
MKGNGEEGITLKGNLMVLKEVMAKFEDVKLAYLFGSYAEGRAMPASDIDIAVLTKKRGVIPYLSAEISNALNIPEERISILNLDDITPKILLRIFSCGIKLLDREAHEEDLKNKLELETIDLIEDERAGFYAWVKGNPLDEALIKRIITQLCEDVEDLEAFLKRDIGDVKLDKNLRKAFERTMQTSIEGSIDLLRHIISGLNLGVAEYYKDYVEICKEKGVIGVETAERMLELIPTRHILVHRYTIDLQKLWLDAKILVETIPKLREEVRNYLKGKLGEVSLY